MEDFDVWVCAMLSIQSLQANDSAFCMFLDLDVFENNRGAAKEQKGQLYPETSTRRDPENHNENVLKDERCLILQARLTDWMN